MIKNTPSPYHIILDVNGLLIARGDPFSTENIKSDFTVNGRPCYKRPYLDEFLSFCMSNFKGIGIWTSMSRYNAIPCVEHILKIDNSDTMWSLPSSDKPWAYDSMESDKDNNQKKRLSIIWTQDSCHMRKHSDKDAASWKRGRPIMFKDLYYIWYGNSKVDRDRMKDWGQVLMENDGTFSKMNHCVEYDSKLQSSLVLKRAPTHRAKNTFQDVSFVPSPENTIVIDDNLYKLALTPNNAIIVTEYKAPLNDDITHDNELIDLMNYLNKLIQSKSQDVREWISKTPYEAHSASRQNK